MSIAGTHHGKLASASWSVGELTVIRRDDNQYKVSQDQFAIECGRKSMIALVLLSLLCDPENLFYLLNQSDSKLKTNCDSISAKMRIWH